VSTVLRADADSVQRSYRADAVVSFLSVPVFSRQGVGTALAVLREVWQEERKSVEIRFAGGSRPERTHGIKFGGSIHETGVEHGAALVHAAYFGFITARPEESYEEARQSVMGHHKTADLYTAVEAVHDGTCVSNRKISVDVSNAVWGDWTELARQVRARFLNANPAAQENCQSVTAPIPTFLYSILRGIRSQQSHFAGTYSHNARLYQLECETRVDHRAGEALAAKNLTACPEKIRCLSGKVRELETRRVSSFRLWLEDGSVLPLRIEFQPRSYLRIQLEFDPTIAVPNQPKEAT
jgi:hypothetical protein